MGAMACSRNGCDNVMCTRYSLEHGYICYSCFKELVEKGAETNISQFMKTSPKSVNKEAALARFNVEFPEI